MQILPQQQIDRAAALVQSSGMLGHLALVYEVIEGRMPGTVYVDDIARPHTALVCNDNGFFFAFGSPDARLIAPVVNAWWGDDARAINGALFGATSAWDDPLRDLFGPLDALPVTRLSFELHAPPPRLPVPAGFELQAIDEHIAESILDGSGTGGYGIDPWFINIAGGARAYAALGLGLALTNGGQVASLCGVCGMGGGEVELELGTVPAYRGHGLAGVVSAAFIEQCRARGLAPAYSCDAENAPSIHVAHRLGFAEMETIRGYKLYL